MVDRNQTGDVFGSPQGPEGTRRWRNGETDCQLPKTGVGLPAQEHGRGSNFAKWEAAEQWCKNHGVNWLVLNESNTLGLFKSGQGV